MLVSLFPYRAKRQFIAQWTLKLLGLSDAYEYEYHTSRQCTHRQFDNVRKRHNCWHLLIHPRQLHANQVYCPPTMAAVGLKQDGGKRKDWDSASL